MDGVGLGASEIVDGDVLESSGVVRYEVCDEDLVLRRVDMEDMLGQKETML
jgi:hypothetical protein